MKSEKAMKYFLPAIIALTPSLAWAQAAGLGSFSQALCRALSMVTGNSVLVAFVACVAVVIFFVVLALNEGSSMLTWAIKILIGVAGLIGATSIISWLFNITVTTC
ncbi:MAG: TrbC/VirB2 family protein [Anaerolineae bacterium]|nr:TrbC/VirB2 family protein [Anaerolineae bacterium]MCL4722704.1 TrbC/VirB2 family protein [Rhodocyclaceae bacterium]MCZ2112734.1 TrbC/VirB2 family protein [Anaerolineae bacterium]GIK44814.1 MAG: hypothetical protein BroJett012_07170 [Betaproteobacteria bacterium]